MFPAAPTSTLRKIVEDRLSEFAAGLEPRLEAEAAARAGTARRALAEHLNQAVRRLRGAENFASLGAILADASAPFCGGAAVFRIAGDAIYGERVRGVTEDRAECFAALELPLSSAGCFAPALETGDPAVALGNSGEVSYALVELLAHGAGERVCVFPILAAGKAAGLLYGWGEVDMAAMELLAQAAGMALGLRNELAPPPLVAARQQETEPLLLSIAAAAPVTPAAAPATEPRPKEAEPAARDWSSMTPGERQAHLRAQRFARVQVAEIRLYRPQDVAAGRARRDLYGALRETVDLAREAYRSQFLSALPGMTDYLHEELLHTLANDDASLLGPLYPGPLA